MSKSIKRGIITCKQCLAADQKHAAHGLCNKCYKALPDRREKGSASALSWYHANKEQRKASFKKRYNTEHGQDVAKAKRKRYYEKNKHKFYIKARKRKQGINNLPGYHTEREWQSRLLEFGSRCCYCDANLDSVNITKEHLIPVILGELSSDSIENIIPACRTCNSALLNIELLKVVVRVLLIRARREA